MWGSISDLMGSPTMAANFSPPVRYSRAKTGPRPSNNANRAPLGAMQRSALGVITANVDLSQLVSPPAKKHIGHTEDSPTATWEVQDSVWESRAAEDEAKILPRSAALGAATLVLGIGLMAAASGWLFYPADEASSLSPASLQATTIDELLAEWSF